MKKRNGKSWLRRRGWIIPLALLLVAAAGAGFLSVVYLHADETAARYMRSDDTVTVEHTDYGWRFDGPSEDTALIFYPGGMVEETAYSPLLHALAERGLDVCLVKMPLRMALFNVNGGDAPMKAHDYAHWYVGGHSLGGAMAASYAVGHPQKLEGLILLAAYLTKPMPDNLIEISIIGSEDRVLNWSKVEAGRRHAPSRFYETVIEGGNHAQFGSYGVQRSDGVATISAEEQVAQTVEAIFQGIGK